MEEAARRGQPFRLALIDEQIAGLANIDVRTRTTALSMTCASMRNDIAKSATRVTAAPTEAS